MKNAFFIPLLLLQLSAQSQNFNFVWGKAFGSPTRDYGLVVRVDGQGNSYTAGYFTGTMDADPGPGVFVLNATSQNIFITKLDPAGNFLWAKQVQGSNSTSSAVCYSLDFDANNNFYFTGNFEGTIDFDPGPASFNLQSANSLGYREVYVCKFTTSGNFVWAKQFGGTGSRGMYGSAVDVDPSGNVLSVGFLTGSADFDPGAGVANLSTVTDADQNMFVSKLDNNGNFIWAKKIGDNRGQCWGYSLVTDAFNNVYLTGAFGAIAGSASTVDFDPGPGSTEFSVAAAETDIYVLKLNSDGIFQWVITKNYGVNDLSRSMTIDANNNVAVTGFIFQNNSDVFVAKINPSGTIIWENKFGGNGHEEGFSIDCDENGHVFITGSYEQTVDFDPDFMTYTMTSAGGADIFLTRFDNSGNFVTARSFGGSGTDNGYGLAVLDADNVFLTGSFSTQADLDPSTTSYIVNSNGDDDIFILRLGRCLSINSSIAQMICMGQSFEGYSNTGIYLDTFIASTGCDSIRTLSLTVNPLPKPSLGADRFLCKNDSLVLDPGIFSGYVWQDGSTSSKYVVNKAGIYSVTVQNICGSGSDDIVITSTECRIYFPSGFTPNNDGKNDVFKVLTAFQLNNFNLSIYNRWGGKIFDTKDYTKGWNGKLNGQALDNGIYIWQASFKRPGSNEVVQMKGTLVLTR